MSVLVETLLAAWEIAVLLAKSSGVGSLLAS